MDATERRIQIEVYERGVADVDGALADITDTELDRRPDDGGWSARMVVHHLADSETNSYIRLRQLLAQDDPHLQGYDEAEFARRLRYDRPIDGSLSVFRAVRGASAELLHLADESDWERAGVHSESGPYSMEDWLAIYAAHGRDHADQIARARRGLA